MSPTVSVIIAVHNGRRFLESTLHSVLAQSLHNFHLIVVDDGSSDGSADIVRATKDPRITLIQTENQGVAAARNTGLHQADAPYVVFLDADDLLHVDALDIMVTTLNAAPQSVACFGQHWKIDTAGKPITSREEALSKPLPEEKTLWHLLAKNIIVNGGALAIRTDAARQAGGYDPALKVAEDWEFWCRLASHGDFIALPDQLLLYYRRHSGGADFTQRTAIKDIRLTAIEKIYSNPAITSRFSRQELASRRRMLEMDLYWSTARNLLHTKRHAAFISSVLLGLCRYPDSLLQAGYGKRLLRQLVPLSRTNMNHGGGHA